MRQVCVGGRGSGCPRVMSSTILVRPASPARRTRRLSAREAVSVDGTGSPGMHGGARRYIIKVASTQIWP